MKAIYVVLALSASLPACAQAPAPSPSASPSGTGQFFQAPAAPDGQSPWFRLQRPQTQQQFTLHGPMVLKPVPKLSSPPADPATVRHPQGFVQHDGKPLLQNLYPGLQFMPTELARLDAPAAPGSGTKALPIPRTFPKAKVEPIPTTWEQYRTIPILVP